MPLLFLNLLPREIRGARPQPIAVAIYIVGLLRLCQRTASGTVDRQHANTFDSMLTNRAYRPGCKWSAALE
jgi:hypothetical protein